MAPQGAGYVCKIEWVDPSDACSKKRALAHADQESRRRRRWMQQEQLLKARKSTLEAFGIADGSPQSQPASPCPSSPGQMIMDFTPAQVRKGSVTENTEKAAKNGNRKGQSFDHTSKRSQNPRKFEPLDGRRSSTSSVIDEIRDDIVPDGVGIRESFYADPQTWLSSSRKDSFQSLFSGLDHEAQRLVDHYMIVLPSLLFNVQKFMPFKEFTWALASAGPLAVRAIIITFSATHLARLRGLKESVQSIQEKQTVIKMLQSRMEGPLGLLQKDDETISAILAITSTENQFGSPTTALLHMRAAMQLVRRRGGPQALDQNRKLAAYTNWVDFTVPRPDGIEDLPNLSSHPPRTQHSADQNLTDPSCMHSDIEDFITFLASAQSLSLQHARIGSATMPRRHSMEPSYPVYQLLLSPVDFGGRDTKRVTIHTRLAALIYIHAILWDYRRSPALCERFMQHFQTSIAEQDIERNLSIVLLVWILLKMDADDVMPPLPASLLPHAIDLNDERNPDERRPWYVARMLRIAKLLSTQTWAKVNDALLGLLDMSRDGQPLLQQKLGGQWKEKIRKEILEGGHFRAL